jgi:hypothetical protein
MMISDQLYGGISNETSEQIFQVNDPSDPSLHERIYYAIPRKCRACVRFRNCTVT